jgi:hypothetical protein
MFLQGDRQTEVPRPTVCLLLPLLRVEHVQENATQGPRCRASCPSWRCRNAPFTRGRHPIALVPLGGKVAGGRAERSPFSIRDGFTQGCRMGQ